MVTIGSSDSVSELAGRVAPEGDLLVVADSVEELERLRRETAAPNVSYLIGSLDVLPLTDSSVDEVLATAVVGPDAAGECFRVLRGGGKLVLAAPDEDLGPDVLNLEPREVEQLFIDAGFTSVRVAADAGHVVILARKP